MACGTPVLCSTRGALVEVVGDAATKVDPEDVAALKAQLVTLASDLDLRAKLRAAGLERARRFDWQWTASKTLEVYAAAFRTQTVTKRLAVAREAISN
jgi:glycosyltransferase involved in cell wall biosynthesis